MMVDVRQTISAEIHDYLAGVTEAMFDLNDHAGSTMMFHDKVSTTRGGTESYKNVRGDDLANVINSVVSSLMNEPGKEEKIICNL